MEKPSLVWSHVKTVDGSIYAVRLTRDADGKWTADVVAKGQTLRGYENMHAARQAAVFAAELG